MKKYMFLLFAALPWHMGLYSNDFRGMGALSLWGLTDNGAEQTPGDTLYFTVIKARGIVRLHEGEKLLHIRNEFSNYDSLTFKAPTDRLLVIDQNRGTYIISPKEGLKGYQLKALGLKAGYRTNPIMNSYLEFRKFLEGRKLLILGEKIAIEVGQEEFPISERQFFYVRYDWRGEEAPVNKKLPSEGQLIYLDKAALFKVNGQPISMAEAQNYRLFYYDAIKEESLQINRFYPVFPDEALLKEELMVILDGFTGSDMGKEEVEASIINYLNSEYGTPEKKNLRDWFRKELGIELE